MEIKKDEAINVIRGVAIILVVFSHSLYAGFSSESQFLYEGLQRLARDGTVVFVLISGYLYFYLRSKYEFLNYIKTKVKNVVFPYVIVSLPAICMYVFGFKDTHIWMDIDFFSEKSFLYKIVYLYVTGAHLGPLWFIPMIFLFFLVSPITNFIVDKIPHAPLFFVCLFLSTYFPRSESNSNVLLSSLHFYPLYIIGGLLFYNRERWLSLLGVSFYKKLMILLFFVLVFGSVLGLTSGLGFDIPILFDKLILFVVLYSYFDRAAGGVFLKRILNFFAVFSFPIFFIHGYLIYLTKMILGGYVFNDLIMYFIWVVFVTVFSLLLSLFFAYLVGWIFRDRARYIVGLNYKEVRKYYER